MAGGTVTSVPRTGNQAVSIPKNAVDKIEAAWAYLDAAAARISFLQLTLGPAGYSGRGDGHILRGLAHILEDLDHDAGHTHEALADVRAILGLG